MNETPFLLLCLAGPFVCALVGSAIGANRGRRGAGTLLGLLLGPIGWIVVLLGPDYRAACAHCRAPLAAPDATVCARCGREQPPPARRPGEPVTIGPH